MQTSSTLVAYWGAALSTLLAVWTLYKDLRDAGKLKVDASLYEWDEIPPLSDNEDDDGPARRMYEVDFTITNIGRRPVNVIALGYGNIRNTKHRLFSILPTLLKALVKTPADRFEATLRTEEQLPKRLDPADFITIKWDNLHFLNDKGVSLFVTDSLGHYFFVTEADMRRMKRNYLPANRRPSTVDHVIGKVRY
jgi:hypothetical protein